VQGPILNDRIAVPAIMQPSQNRCPAEFQRKQLTNALENQNDDTQLLAAENNPRRNGRAVTRRVPAL
jgi:hypothetical protein